MTLSRSLTLKEKALEWIGPSAASFADSGLDGPVAMLSTAAQVITTPPAGSQDGFPEVIKLGDGFLVAWNRASNAGPTAVVAQKFDADGHTVGGLMTIEPAALGIGGKPELLDLGGGNVAVFWNGSVGLKGAILDTATGALSHQQTIVADAADWMHDVIRLPSGDIAMTTMAQNGINGDLELLVIDDATLGVVSIHLIHTFAAATNTYDHTLVAFGTGGVALFRDRTDNQLYAQTFDGSGALVGAATKVNTTTENIPFTSDVATFAPQAVALAGGGYAVVWENVEGSGGDRLEVRGRVFDAAGHALGPDFLVNETAPGSQYDAQIVALSNGGFAVWWNSDVGVNRNGMIRYFDANGGALTGEIGTGALALFGSGVDHQLTVLADGTIANVYPENFAGLSLDGINQPTFGTVNADTLAGTSGDDVVLADAGDDTITAGAGNDAINGGAGNDLIEFGGNYTAGDAVDGGLGGDTVRLNGEYSNLTFGPRFNSIETIVLGGAHTYSLTLTDAMTAAGRALTIDGSALTAAHSLTLFGGAETNGKLVVTGGLGADSLFGGSGADTLVGGGGADLLNGANGGADVLRGAAGDDLIQMAAGLSADDRIDGGTGADIVSLAGNYSAGVVFSKSTMKNVERINLTAGSAYRLTLADETVGKNKLLTVDASALGAANGATINGSLDTNGTLVLLGGAGTDTLIGGKGDDTLAGGEGNNTLDISFGGSDTATGGSGTDTIRAGAQFSKTDVIDGGAGFDELLLNGDYAKMLVLQAGTIHGIETVTLTAGHSYGLAFDDANVAAGQTLQVIGVNLGTLDKMVIDGSRETNSSLQIMAGQGADTLIGGAGNDNITASNGANLIDISMGGSDVASGGFDNDTFFAGAALNTTDRIQGSGGTDTVILNGDYSTLLAFDSLTLSEIETVQLTKGHTYNLQVYVDQNLSLTVDGSKLASTDAMIMSASGGDRAHYVFLGGAGADTFQGGAGKDTISGGDGIDIFKESSEGDTLTGGAGSDHFVYTFTKSFAFADTITDISNTDVIDLSAIDADTHTAGDQAFHLVGANFTGAAGELRIYSLLGNTVIEADVDGGGFPDLRILLQGDHLDFAGFAL